MLFFTLLLAAGCGGSEPTQSGETAVATVGDAKITARAFALSYGLGFAHLKRGDDPRGTYLQHMIDEALLAAEGYRLGLDAAPDVRRRVESLREELLVEQVFAREVNEQITVTDAEIREAMQRDAVRFRLRYLPAPTLDAARRLQAEVRSAGFDAALDRRLADEAGRGWRREDFESPFLSRHEVDPALLDAVAALPVGEVSDPVAYRGSYLVLQVEEVRRDPVATAPGSEERARYEQLLFQQKAKHMARRFIGETMGPLDVRIKAGPYRALRQHLRAWYRDAPPAGNLLDALAGAEGSHADSLRALLPRILFTTRTGDWTVEAFLRAYPVERYPLSTQSEPAFERDLYDAVGLTLRDRHFVRLAEAEELDEAPAVREELARWRDKWVYRALVARIADTLAVTDADARAYFERHQARYRSTPDGAVPSFDAVAARVHADAEEARLREVVARRLDALRQQIPVVVYREVLDTLSVADPSGPAAPDVVVFEGHTGRMAFPVVDPTW